MSILIQFIAFIVTVLVLVSFHEAGHFLVAKLLNVKVIRFSIGFGKPLLRGYDKKGTEYVIALLPLGGYVKLLDEREGVISDSEKPFAFNRQPLWAKTLIVLAGPVTNLLFAIVGFSLMFIIGIHSLRPIVGEIFPGSLAAKAGLQPGDEILTVDGKSTPTFQKVLMAVAERLGETTSMTIQARKMTSSQVITYQMPLKNWSVNALKPAPLESLGIAPIRPPLPATIGKIQSNSPAMQAGLHPDDLLMAINGQPIKDWYQLVDFIHQHPHQKIKITYQRQHKLADTTITIAKKQPLFGRSQGYIGVLPLQINFPPQLLIYRQYPPWPALKLAVRETADFITFNVIILKKMIIGQISLGSLGGPITIFQTADEAFEQGVSIFLGFLGLISVMLAFINILPIPGLDGGHLLNYLLAFLLRRPLSLKYEMMSIQIGMILLITLMLIATFNDILRLLNQS